MKYNQSMMTALRGGRGSRLDDASQDADIEAMSPVEVVRDCAAWKLGDPYWATVFAGWMHAAGAKPTDFDIESL